MQTTKLSTEKRIYASTPQQRFLKPPANRKTFVAGRGGGKSFCISFQDWIRLDSMHRAKSFLAGPYFGQLVSKTVPAYLEGLNMLGLVEYDPKKRYGHYVVFKKPPEDWPKPFSRVEKDYSKVITFATGYSKELISLYGADNARGGSYDCGDIDESALCDKEDLDKVLYPSLRGNLWRISSPLQYQMCDYTSPPWLPSGQFIYDTEELMKELPLEYHFVESKTRDNKAISEIQIERMRRTLPGIVFEVEVEGKRITRLPNGFYPTFNDKRHVVFDTTRHQFDDKTGLWLVSENFIDRNQPIETSWDFNAAITSLIVAQQQGNEQRIDNNLYVKESTKHSLVVALAEEFCEKYASHEKKVVDIHGDRNGNNKSAGNPLTHYQEIENTLRSKGWDVRIKVEGLDSEHHVRHLIITDILGESMPGKPVVRIHGRCKALIYAIQNTPVLPDYKKNKASERSSMPQEKATHLTDCFDNLLIRKFARLFGRSSTTFSEPIFIG
jgi:hypothetical protein